MLFPEMKEEWSLPLPGTTMGTFLFSANDSIILPHIILMEENQVPIPTGLTPTPTLAPREEPSEPKQSPVPETESEPETGEQDTDEEIYEKFFRNYSLSDVDPRLVMACSALFGACIPLLNIILPFILWILWRDKDPRLEETGRNVLNIQLTATMWIIISAMTIPIAIGSVLLPLAILGWAFATIAYPLKLSSKNYIWLPPGTIPFIR